MLVKVNGSDVEMDLKLPTTEVGKRGSANVLVNPKGIRYRICTKCKECKLETKEFFGAHTGSFRPTCRICERARDREYDKNNPEKRKAKSTKRQLEKGEEIKNQATVKRLAKRPILIVNDKKYKDVGVGSVGFVFEDEERNVFRKCAKCDKLLVPDTKNFSTVHHRMNTVCRVCVRDLDNKKYAEKSLNEEWFQSKSERCKNYNYKNRDKLNNYHNDYNKNRRKIDPAYRLRQNMSRVIHNCLSRQGESIKKYLPYSLEELKIYIESQFESWMNWDNQGLYLVNEWDDNDESTWKWQVDHIIPQSDLPYDSMEHENFKNCWSLENLRPLSAKQNQFDGASRIRHKKNLKTNE